MGSHPGRSPGLKGYAFAAGAVAVAALLRLALALVLGEQGPYFPFVLAVLVSAWYGGLRPGLLATALGAAGGLYLAGPSAGAAVGPAAPLLFVAIGLAASLLCGALHAARVRAEDRQRALERAEAELRKNRDIFRLVHTIAKIGHWEWDSLTDENRWSTEIEALYGVPPGQFKGNYEAWARLVHPDDLARAEEDVRRALETGKYFAEFRVLWPDGSVHWLEARALVFKDGHDRPVRIMGVNMDVTERKRAEEALQEADRHKDEFLALLGHELRNPLAPLRNAVSVLRVESAGEPTVARMLPLMERQLATLTRLVDDLLDVSRVSRGKVELRKERVDLTALAARAAESAGPALDEHGHCFEMDLQPGPLCAEADPARVEQVLANLLSNAARYTPPGGHVRLSLAREGGEAVLRVRDSGIGIRPEELPAVWETGRQAGRVEGRAPEGLGLGLTVVRRLVELHGGTVDVASEGRGKGSEFTVRLPALPEGNHPPQRSAQPEAPAAPARARRVLVVDDNRDAADSLALVLQLAGHETRTAGDGLQALAAAREFRPHAVFLDIGLPGKMDGYEVARRLREEPGLEGVLLIAVTGYGTPEDVARARQARFDRHITKPAETDLVRRLLVERLGGGNAG